YIAGQFRRDLLPTLMSSDHGSRTVGFRRAAWFGFRTTRMNPSVFLGHDLQKRQPSYTQDESPVGKNEQRRDRPGTAFNPSCEIGAVGQIFPLLIFSSPL